MYIYIYTVYICVYIYYNIQICICIIIYKLCIYTITDKLYMHTYRLIQI